MMIKRVGTCLLSFAILLILASCSYKMDKKYEDYIMDNNSYEFALDKESAETFSEELLYDTWYNTSDGTVLKIDNYQIGGKDYYLYSAMYIDDAFGIYFHFADDPSEFNAYVYESWYNFGDTANKSLVINIDSQDSNGTKANSEYSTLPKKEFDEMYSRLPHYDEETVISKTFEAFRGKIASNYTGVELMYHSASYSDGYVTFDFDSQIYTCTVVCEYTTNIFNFYGTDTSAYYVTAQLRDTGNGLAIIAIQIN